MPPGPAYNLFCVAHGALDVLSQAARIRATQLEQQSSRVLRRGGVQRTKTRAKNVEEDYSGVILAANAANRSPEGLKHPVDSVPEAQPGVQVQAPLGLHEKQHHVFQTPRDAMVRQDATPPPLPTIAESHPVGEAAEPPRRHIESVSLDTEVKAETQSPSAMGSSSTSLPLAQLHAEMVPPTLAGIPENRPSADAILPDTSAPVVEPVPRRSLQSSKVPSSRLGRLFHYGGLAASLGYGAASELLRRSTTSSDQQQSSLMMTEGNIKRLVSKLTKMRGAALKIGQFMSIQDSHVLPPEVEDIFRRVQDSAHYMPDWQMEEVMTASLGPSWMDNFVSFDRVPFAAASIGQVHSAVLAATASPTGKEEPVAVKIQFPNIVNSIDSDLGYVKLLLTAGRLLPKGLFLDRTIQVMKDELADECNYQREASFMQRFGSPEFLGADPRFRVPWVWEGSTERVLVMQRVDGVSVGGNVIERLSQDDRNEIATRIIDLCLKELFAFRVMQTDPNWTNFLWNDQTKQIELVDFGATREYSKEFIDNWLRLLQAAASDDRQACIDWSLKVGYLTGEENEVMLDAHVASMTLLATPFKQTTHQPFAFGPGSTWADVTAKIREQIPVMLQHRLTPPPRETYSLNRKLSGAFLLAARLNAEVDCRTLWEQVIKNYRFD